MLSTDSPARTALGPTPHQPDALDPSPRNHVPHNHFPRSAAAGLWWGLLGVVAFSLTVPLTRVAVAGLPPLFVGAGRAAVAGFLALAVLLVTRQPLPTRHQWWRLAVVALGIVVGFPFLSTLALQTAPASHGAVVGAVLPAVTAVLAVLRGRERPRLRFWLFSAAGALAVLLFASLRNGGLEGLQAADWLLFGAIAAAAVGYAEGGLLSRELGSWQTVSWALVLSLPVMVLLSGYSVATEPFHADAAQWGSFTYLAVVSMYLGYFAWYRGLAIGPMTSVSQVQLVQPVLSIVWAALLLGEAITWPTLLGGLTVVLCAGFAVRSRR
ncbi:MULTISPECIES: DMT family transporter [Arthrobacter]|uniref:DMT family transporter n=2 Tax=Arthrobacter TaxID=1663 RepID=A0ABU9KLN0_9MICC|nr:DMT family transporter [Arthrobacter sp. YJM1]MDP5228440.1 DMT family transporter [Arthrobacter sp. YJM1]